MTGEELKKRRKERGLAQRELSKASGVAQKTISQAENGRAQLSRGSAQKLEQALQR
jgi:transcriptional regulator with XRE-family HTH domain